MKPRYWVLSIVLMSLPMLMFAKMGATAVLEFDPAKNTIGSGSKPVSNGSIETLTFLSGTKDPVTIAIRLINGQLSILGLASLILMLYAGIVWFKASDNEEEVSRAKEIIQGGLTGLMITLLAFGLAQLLFNQLNTIVTGP